MRPSTRSEHLRSHVLTWRVVRRAVLAINRGLDADLREEVLQDANVRSVHSLPEVPVPECQWYGGWACGPAAKSQSKARNKRATA